MLGYCDGRAGQYALATRAMDAAHARDPRNWQYVYGQAIMAGISGRTRCRSPRAALLRNPLDAARAVAGEGLEPYKDPARRREIAVRAGIPFE